MYGRVQMRMRRPRDGAWDGHGGGGGLLRNGNPAVGVGVGFTGRRGRAVQSVAATDQAAEHWKRPQAADVMGQCRPWSSPGPSPLSASAYR
jgi:hypothetical protein